MDFTFKNLLSKHKNYLNYIKKAHLKQVTIHVTYYVEIFLNPGVIQKAKMSLKCFIIRVQLATLLQNTFQTQIQTSCESY